MRPLTILTAACLLTAVAAQDAKTDRDRLQGDWQLTAMTIDGRETPAEKTKDYRLRVRGDEYVVHITDTPRELKFKIDPRQTPKAMDLTYQSGENKGRVNRAIYRLDGDTLTMCRHREADQDRPADFESKPGSGLVLTVWKRGKP
jgi:uncharacterized protein (TIGR03067 family)